MSDIQINKNVFFNMIKQNNVLTSQESETLNSVWSAIDKEDASGNKINGGDEQLNEKEWISFKNLILTKAKDLYAKFSGAFDDMNTENKEDVLFKPDNPNFKTEGAKQYLGVTRYFDKTKYTKEELQKNFPDCEIVVEGYTTLVKDKNGSIVLEYTESPAQMDFFVELYNEDETLSGMLSYNENFVLKTLIKPPTCTEFYENGNIKKQSSYEDNTFIEYDKNGKKIRERNSSGENINYHYDKEGNELYTTVKRGNEISVYSPDGQIKTKYTDTNSIIGQYKEGTISAKELFDSINEYNAYEMIPLVDKIAEDEFGDLGDDLLAAAVLMYQSKEEIDSAFSAQEYLKGKLIDYAANNDIYVEDIRNIIGTNDSASKLLSRIKKAQETDTVQITANGKIDSGFKQGGTGDCWLLATINAMKQNPKTLELLNNALSVNDDGSIDVEFQQLRLKYNYSSRYQDGKWETRFDETDPDDKYRYSVSKDQLESSYELANGDLDVRALEIGVNNLFLDLLSTNLNGREVDTGFKIFAGGLNVDVISLDKTSTENPLKNLINKENIVVIAGTDNPSSAQGNGTEVRIPGCYAQGPDGEKVPLYGPHGYTITKVEENAIYLRNPWDSEAELCVDIETFNKAFLTCAILNVDG